MQEETEHIIRSTEHKGTEDYPHAAIFVALIRHELCFISKARPPHVSFLLLPISASAREDHGIVRRAGLLIPPSKLRNRHPDIFLKSNQAQHQK